MPRCPNQGCGEELANLAYSESITGTEWGSARFPTTTADFEMQDREINDSYDTEFSCPICEYMLSSHEVTVLNEEYENTQPQRNINRRRTYMGFDIRPETHTELAVECTHCHHVYNDTLIHEMICPRCNKTWSPPERDITNIKINNQNNNNP